MNQSAPIGSGLTQDAGWTIRQYQVGMRVEHDWYGYGMVDGIRETPGTPGIGVAFAKEHRAFYAGSGHLFVDGVTAWCGHLRAELSFESLLPSASRTSDAYPLALAASEDLFHPHSDAPLRIIESWLENRDELGLALLGSRCRVSATRHGAAFAVIDGLLTSWDGPVDVDSVHRALRVGPWISLFRDAK